MNNKDLYGILEIPRDASADEIKSSYRRLALKYHPDTNNDGDDSEERFKAINEAYSVLGDKDKRKRYDLGGYDFLKEIRGQGTPYGFQGRRGRFGSFGCMGRGMGMGACFNRRGGGFGRAFRHPFSRYQYERGAVYDIPLTRDEALKGTEKVVNLYAGSIKNTIKVKIPSNLKDGDFLIMKNGNSQKMGGDIYLRVKLLD